MKKKNDENGARKVHKTGLVYREVSKEKEEVKKVEKNSKYIVTIKDEFLYEKMSVF